MKILGVFVAFWSALSPPLALANGDSAARQAVPSPKEHATVPVARSVSIGDVVLQKGGALNGVIVSGPSDTGPGKPVAGVRIALLRDGKMVAETRSDRNGRFVVSHLRGGKYIMAVSRQDGVEWSFHRLWTPSAAPPKASEVARVVLGSGIVRGQGAMPAVSFSEAALMAGVVVGAVAAPVIYHNAQKSNRVPASP